MLWVTVVLKGEWSPQSKVVCTVHSCFSQFWQVSLFLLLRSSPIAWCYNSNSKCLEFCPKSLIFVSLDQKIFFLSEFFKCHWPVGCHMPFTQEWLPSERWSAAEMVVLSAGSPISAEDFWRSIRVKALLGSWSPPWSRPFLPSYSVWQLSRPLCSWEHINL